jgi:glutamate N-acetyltransferase/amino-acid N-acetyltransferase
MRQRQEIQEVSRQMTGSLRVPGFRFAGAACGIKESGKKDLAVLFSERPAVAAALFTTNQIKSPAVVCGMERMRKSRLQAVVVNSGNANACTGTGGLEDAEAMCADAGARLGVSKEYVLPSSTGIIGVRLPMTKIRSGIEAAVARLSADGLKDAAEAIMTTDVVPKIVYDQCRIGGRVVTVAGVAKGAGMLAPNMATMLAYVFTDAVISPTVLKPMLRRGAQESFHAITVDGDRSTNDTLLCMANGLAGNAPIQRGTAAEKAFERILSKSMKELALKLVEDAEGATKLVEVRVEGARTVNDARRVAFAVANSMLVKTAFFGEDPNIGRIMVVVGSAGAPVEPGAVEVAFDRVKVVRRGVATGTREKEAALVMRQRSFCVRIFLGTGRAAASVWTCDLSHEYVRINSEYRT